MQLRADSGVTVKTSRRTYCAEKVIIIAGPWIARFLPRASRITIGSSLRRLVQATDLSTRQ
jgi:glycine/D-amino acid oxidase-like deaminating enzyme